MHRPPSPEQRLAGTYEQYERALRDGDRHEVTSARLSLCRALESSGWDVPAEVRDQMQRDERTLRALAEEASLQGDLLRPPSHRAPWALERRQASAG